ncbi:MAG: CcmD family protein [Candidatus Eisenbacteria bacterium]
MSPLQYLGLAYAFIWVGLGLYLFGLGRRIDRVRGEIEELNARITDGGRG